MIAAPQNCPPRHSLGEGGQKTFDRMNRVCWSGRFPLQHHRQTVARPEADDRGEHASYTRAEGR